MRHECRFCQCGDWRTSGTQQPTSLPTKGSRACHGNVVGFLVLGHVLVDEIRNATRLVVYLRFWISFLFPGEKRYRLAVCLSLPLSLSLSLSLSLTLSLSLSLSLSLYKFFLFIFICKTIMRIEPVARSTRFDSTRLDSVANLEHTLEMRAILPTNSTLPIALDRTDGCVATSSDDFALCTRRRETRDRLGRPSFSLASRPCCSSAPSPRTPLFLVLAESANAAKILSVARSIRRVPL